MKSKCELLLERNETILKLATALPSEKDRLRHELEKIDKELDQRKKVARKR